MHERSPGIQNVEVKSERRSLSTYGAAEPQN
jgi:hypothetical protein